MEEKLIAYDLEC